jgi:hypothetical protein
MEGKGGDTEMSVLNRAEKRNAFAKAKRNPDAIWCPVCKHKTLFIALPHEDTCDIYCSVCGSLRDRGVPAGKFGVMPKEFVKGHLYMKRGIDDESRDT